MIKRRYYRQEHGDRDDGSDTSSSSDSEVEAQSSDGSEEVEEEELEEQPSHDDELSSRVNLEVSSPPSSSGYESENSSADELAADSPGLASDDETENEQQKLTGSSKREKAVVVEKLERDDSLPADVLRCILKCRSVFKCRLCPKIVCLKEESLITHLKSKRHARSEKLLSDGRLKHYLNSDGEEEVMEEDGETHAERHARILALAQDNCEFSKLNEDSSAVVAGQEKPKKRPRGRQRQRLRLKRKKDKGDAPKETGKKEKDKSNLPNDTGKKAKDKGKLPKETSKKAEDKGKSPKETGKKAKDKSKSPKETTKKAKRRRQDV